MKVTIKRKSLEIIFTKPNEKELLKIQTVASRINATVEISKTKVKVQTETETDLYKF